MVRNFLFHRVSPERDRLWDPMDVPLFEKCIKFIANNYEVLLIEDLVFSDKLHSKNKVATIMFDDGYKDNIDYAADILKKHNCKASFYVVTNCIDQNVPTWTHTLECLFQQTRKNEINLDFDFLPSEFRVSRLGDTDARIKYAKKFEPFLKKLPHSKRELVMNEILSAYNDVELPKLMMNWNEVKQLKDDGHYISSHTDTHCMLGTMENEDDVYRELEVSAQKIERNLGYFPLSISYPVGSYNQRTKELSAKAGYKIGLAVKQDIYLPGQDDLYEISRIELYNEPWWKTKMRISNNLENIKRLIGYK